MSDFFAKIKKDVKYKILSILHNKESKAGLNWYQKRKLKYVSGKTVNTYSFHDFKIAYRNGVELKHGLLEIFVDELYKFKSNNSNPLIIDCGSNIGLSVLYFKKLFPSSYVIAFEPDSINYELLSLNTKNLPGVEINNKAVWIENTELFFENTGTMSASLSPEKKTNTKPVQTIRLKELLTRKIDFLKIDIEGAEYKVIDDCKENLINVDNIFVEYHGKFSQVAELNSILRILQERNFKFYIKEAANIYPNPFINGDNTPDFDIQLNIFGFK